MEEKVSILRLHQPKERKKQKQENKKGGITLDNLQQRLQLKLKASFLCSLDLDDSDGVAIRRKLHKIFMIYH